MRGFFRQGVSCLVVTKGLPVPASIVAASSVFPSSAASVSGARIGPGAGGRLRCVNSPLRARREHDAMSQTLTAPRSPGSDDPGVRLGLVEMLEFYEFWERELPKVFRDWDAEQAERGSSVERGRP